MKKYFFLQPRQSGKTSCAIYEFSKDPNNTLFVTCNFHQVWNICNKLNYSKSHFISSENLKNGYNLKNIILDEYMFFKNKKEVCEYITYHTSFIENLYIFSTSNRIYDELLFNFVKDGKKNNSLNINDINTIWDNYGDKDTFLTIEKFQNELVDLYYNFLTDPDVILIDRPLKPENNITQTEDELRNQLGEYHFNLEIKNQYLTEK
jgi:hypothetical protein